MKQHFARFAVALALLVASLLAPPPAAGQFAWPESQKTRRLLLESGSAALDRTVYLYHHWAASGFNAGERVVAVPYGDNRLACYVFGTWTGNWPTHLGRMHAGCAAVCTQSDDASVVTTGTWSNSTQALAHGGAYRFTATAGNSKSLTAVGSRVGIIGVALSTGGTAIVAIDGDETRATLLPAVTQTDVTAGKFTSADLGKRYIDFYKAGTGYYDQHWACADDLSFASHTVTVRATGLADASASGARVQLSAFFFGGPTTRTTNSGARIVYLRPVQFPRQGFSSVVNTPSFSPTGFGNPQFLGENHANESLVSEQWYVDGAAVTTTAGAAPSTGREISYDRLTTYNHANASGCATRRVVHTARADVPLQMTARGSVTWNTAGTSGASYFGMLPLSEPNPDNSTKQTQFTRALLLRDDAPIRFAIPTAGAGAEVGSGRADTIAVYSDAHDTVALVHNARPDLIDGQRVGRSWLEDRSDSGLDKAYIARITTLGGVPQSEAIAAGDVHTFECGWRIFEVPSAATRLAE